MIILAGRGEICDRGNGSGAVPTDRMSNESHAPPIENQGQPSDDLIENCAKLNKMSLYDNSGQILKRNFTEGDAK